jgi:hypothetical protein
MADEKKVEAAGIELHSLNTANVAITARGGAQSGAIFSHNQREAVNAQTTDPTASIRADDRDLSLVNAAWPTLPTAIKAGIVAMVNSAVAHDGKIDT